MIVISTAFAAPLDAKARCLASVSIETPHFYIDAAQQDPPRSHFENLIAAVDRVLDDEIIVSLDGDDWLTPDALAKVQQAHDAGALVTYGSYVYADGRPGHCREMTPVELAEPRKAPWLASHLKTFRAGLFRCIQHEHLKGPDGRWLEHARDLALMFPLLEMVGPRAVYIPDILYVYNYANSTEHNGTTSTLSAERAAVEYVRSLPKYKQPLGPITKHIWDGGGYCTRCGAEGVLFDDQGREVDLCEKCLGTGIDNSTKRA